MRQWPKSCLRVQGVAYAVTESINETALENRPEEIMQIFSSVVIVWFFEMNRRHFLFLTMVSFLHSRGFPPAHLATKNESHYLADSSCLKVEDIFPVWFWIWESK